IADRPQLLRCDEWRVRQLADQLVDVQDHTHRLALENPDDVLVGRLALALEELLEWLLAHGRGHLVAGADAWADGMYVLLGDAVAAGLPADDLIEEVHAANMTKSPDQDRAGKAIKGAGYRPPEIGRILKLANLQL